MKKLNAACPCGGEHDYEHVTGFWGGLWCRKCHQPEVANVEPAGSVGDCPKGGQHESHKPMGAWGSMGGRQCLKCGERF